MSLGAVLRMPDGSQHQLSQNLHRSGCNNEAELRALMAALNRARSLGARSLTVRTVMDDHPLTCTPDTELDEVRRMMLSRHARYMPVMTQKTLMGVISFYDVAKAVVDGQDFENRMLKAYIRDWPVSEDGAGKEPQALL